MLWYSLLRLEERQGYPALAKGSKAGTSFYQKAHHYDHGNSLQISRCDHDQYSHEATRKALMVASVPEFTRRITSMDGMKACIF